MKPNFQSQLSLYCFSHAGAGASAFREWSSAFPAEIDVIPVQYPGRENRVREPLLTRLEPLVETLLKDLRDLTKPFAFFGHSMGALVSYEITRKLYDEGQPLPVKLFVSGRRAPGSIDGNPPLHLLDDAALIEKLRELDGMPDSVFQYPELIHFWLKILRADLETCETYKYANTTPLTCPITAFGGLDDAYVPRAELAAWQNHTRGEFSLHMFPGGHFFLKDSREKLLNTILNDLSRASWRGGLFGNNSFLAV